MSLDYELCDGGCCRNPHGVCSHHRHCAHHVNADNDHKARRTYANPTQDKALNNVTRERNRRNK